MPQTFDELTDILARARVRALESQPSAERPYRELLENAGELVYTHDLEGNITSVNAGAVAVTGYSAEELLRRNIADLLTGDSLALVRRVVERKLGDGAPITCEATLRGKDGRLVAMQISARLLFCDGRPAEVLGVGRGAPAKTPSDSHLRLLRSVVVNANDAVLIAEARPADHLGGRIIYVNEAFTRMTGYEADEAQGRTPRILFGPQTDRDQLNLVRQSLSQGEPVRVELTNYRKDGSAYWVDVNFVPIKSEDGQFTHWVAVQRETTERKLAEDLERDRNRVLEMVAKNEPLEGVLGRLAQMVERQCPDLRCSILLLKNGEMAQAAGASLPADAVHRFQEAGVCGWPNPAKADVYRGLLPGLRMGSGWSIPILSGSGAVLGAFAAMCSVPRSPRQEELDLVSKVTRLATIAIEQRQLTDRLVYQAMHDALTGLPNRMQFEERLHDALAQARRRGWLAAVLFVDLDRFKQINDTLGHQVGDALLQQVARRLQGCLRKSDALARMGGDEFTVLLTELKDAQYAQLVAQKLLDTFHEPFHVEGYELFVTASIGISVCPFDGRDATTLQRNADSAMYRAKNQGKNNFQVFKPEISATALESLEIENALRRALENGEFQLRYQPQADTSGMLTGLEALLVWSHPKLGLIAPAQFIPVAEESGLIVPIGSWALEQACLQNAEWKRAGQRPVKVAVNVSVTQFMRPGFADSVDRLLRETGLEPSLLELELTESVVIRDVQESARQMSRLRSLGVSLAIDDFGTGYSSLSYLRILPITPSRSTSPSWKRSKATRTRLRCSRLLWPWRTACGCAWWLRASRAPPNWRRCAKWAATACRGI